ncbi:hypothetical protein S245_047510, partial [Arachis hypogaea]
SEGDTGVQVGDMQGTIPVTLGLSGQHSFLRVILHKCLPFNISILSSQMLKSG